MLALRRSVDFARIAARPLSMLATSLRPLLAVETALSRLLRRIVGVPSEVESVFLSREDLQLLLERRSPRAAAPQTRRDPAARAAHDQPHLPLRQCRGAQGDGAAGAGAWRCPRTPAWPPRSRWCGAKVTAACPVFRRRITDLVGVVHVFDLLEAPDLSAPVSEVMRPVSYFPESTPLDEVLLALQRTREHLAVVVDEYGGAAGIITVEDLLEEIVGEIEDEYDAADA